MFYVVMSSNTKLSIDYRTENLLTVSSKDKLEVLVVDKSPIDITLLNDDALTKREREVALLICQGLNNNEISEKLFISYKTTKNHISNILKKMDMATRVDLIVYMYKNKLIPY